MNAAVRATEREQDMARPMVSCICPTYGRPATYQHLLEEAVASFLRQTYPNKELIVLNDCPGQELVCQAPDVRVVNRADRFPTLGDKYNAAVSLARGDLIAPWEDDDISLPWRLALSVDRLGDADYFLTLGTTGFWTTQACTLTTRSASGTTRACSGEPRLRPSGAIPRSAARRTSRWTMRSWTG